MTRPVSFFRKVPILLELYRRKWQGGNIYVTNTIHRFVFSLKVEYTMWNCHFLICFEFNLGWICLVDKSWNGPPIGWYLLIFNQIKIIATFLTHEGIRFSFTSIKKPCRPTVAERSKASFFLDLGWRGRGLESRRLFLSFSELSLSSLLSNLWEDARCTMTMHARKNNWGREMKALFWGCFRT